MLKEGYTLPLLVKPNLTRSPKSSTAMYILTGTYIGSEALHQLMDKDAVEPFQISGLLQPTFLVPKPDNRWRPILDLSNQTIRTSLQQGEWVIAIDFKNTYFHIPIQEQPRKCLRFLIQGRHTSSRSCLSEFTVIPKEVNLMAIHKDVRSHQYLDDWLVRARSHQTCLQHTQDLVNNVSATGLAGDLREVRAGAQTRLRFCRLPVRPQV